MPDVDEEMLLLYHKHLAQNLSFPFEAEYSSEYGPLRFSLRRLTVLGLVDPDSYHCDEDHGLVCQARQRKQVVELPLAEVEVEEGEPNHQLIDDYSYWFWNHR